MGARFTYRLEPYYSALSVLGHFGMESIISLYIIDDSASTL